MARKFLTEWQDSHTAYLSHIMEAGENIRFKHLVKMLYSMYFLQGRGRI